MKKTKLTNKPWMLLCNGKRFFPDYPQPRDIDIEVIAHSLSQICRFGGHTRTTYSVAQHSWMVSWLLQELGTSPTTQLIGLLHDAAESFIGDITRPVKHLWVDYPEIEQPLTQMIYEKFGLPPIPYGGILQFADDTMLVTERRDLMPSCRYIWPVERLMKPLPRKIIPISSRKAEDMFLNRFHQLYDPY